LFRVVTLGPPLGFIPDRLVLDLVSPGINIAGTPNGTALTFQGSRIIGAGTAIASRVFARAVTGTASRITAITSAGTTVTATIRIIRW